MMWSDCESHWLRNESNTEHHICAFNLSMSTLVAFGTVVFLSSPMINFYLPHLTWKLPLAFHHFGEAGMVKSCIVHIPEPAP